MLQNCWMWRFWFFLRDDFLTVWILYFEGWFPFVCFYKAWVYQGKKIWYMASSQEENSSRKKLATERFTKPTFNHRTQVILRNLGIHRKMLTLRTTAMHLNNWAGKRAGRKLSGERWLTVPGESRSSVRPPIWWLLLACLHVPHHSAGHRQSQTPRDTPLWLAASGPQLLLFWPAATSSVFWKSRSLTVRLLSNRRSRAPDSLGSDFSGVLGFFRALRMKLTLEAIPKGESYSPPLFVLTAEPTAWEFTEVTFMFTQEVLMASRHLLNTRFSTTGINQQLLFHLSHIHFTHLGCFLDLCL